MTIYKIKTLSLLVLVALVAVSCGTPAIQNDSEIATAVALTVQAQNSLTKVSALPTLTPALPTFAAPDTPEVESTIAPQVQDVPNPGCIPSAELISEYPPDGTVMLPGQYFWKTWTFLNTGTCTWDKSFSLVFWDGEKMGGSASYPLYEIVKPNETKDVSVYLQAPATDGSFTGYWRLKTPWGRDFGVGSLDTSFYVKIGVDSNPQYGITNVDFELVRDPPKDCPINVQYTVNATVTTNGPLKFKYFWDQSDGNESGVKEYTIDEAGSVTFQRSWQISLRDSPNPRWIQFIQTSPEYREYDKVIIDHDCFKIITPTP